MSHSTSSIKLAFYVGTGGRTFFRLITPLIKFWDKSLISHVEIVLEDHNLNYHWVSSRPGGVTSKINYEYDPSEWIFVSLPSLIPEQYEAIESFVFDRSVLSSSYDWAGVIFSAVIPIRLESKSKWFCSELCRAALRTVNHISDKTIPDHSVTPAELFREILPYNWKTHYPETLLTQV